MSNLKKLNEAEVVSSDGFKIKYSRDSLTYVEGDKYLIIPIEHLGGPYEMSVYINKISDWMRKGAAVSRVSEDDLNVVDERVRGCLSFLKRNFSITR